MHKTTLYRRLGWPESVVSRVVRPLLLGDMQNVPLVCQGAHSSSHDAATIRPPVGPEAA